MIGGVKHPGYRACRLTYREVGHLDVYVKVEKLPSSYHGEILRDFCHDLIMGGFYVKCKVIPEFICYSFHGEILRKVKVLT